MKPLTKEISEEFSKGNFKFAYNYFADDIEWNVVGSTAVKGKEAVIDYCNKMLIEIGNSALINTSQIIGENVIAVQGYCDYVNENSTAGRIEYCDVYSFNEEKLREITSYCIEIKKDENKAA